MRSPMIVPKMLTEDPDQDQSERHFRQLVVQPSFRSAGKEEDV